MYPLVFLSVGWLAGLWLASLMTLPAWAGWLWATPAGLAAWRSPRWRWPLAALCALGLGAVRYQWAQPAFDDHFIATHNDTGLVTLEGVVWDEPEARDTRVNLRVRAETLTFFEAAQPITLPVRGLVLITAPRYSAERLAATDDGEWRYGDRVRVTGPLETPPAFDDFSYKDYLARQGVYALVRQGKVIFLTARQGNGFWQGMFDFKTRALRTLAQIFPEPHAALLAGILLGVDANIPPEIWEAFSATGTSHVVAISGFNIAIIAGIFAALANRWFGANRGAVIAIVGIALYTVLVGASASVVRAAIMGSLALLAQRIGRRNAGLNTLAAAALTMTLLNPLTLWDVGFQLSLAATLGLIVYAEPLEAVVRRGLLRFLPANRAGQITEALSETFLLTVAAQITTLPLMAFYFRSVSLVALLANAVILPPQPAVMVLGGLALMGGLIAVPLGRALAWLAWPFTAYTLAFVQWFARWPGATLPLGPLAPAFIVACYALLFGGTWLLSRKPAERWSWLPAIRWADWMRAVQPQMLNVALAVAGVGALIAWSTYFSLPDERLKISVLEVGAGDAVLIQSPSGATALIDTGPSGPAIARALARELPLFTTRLDVLILASPFPNSLGGLPDVLTRYRVGRVILTPAEGQGATYAAAIDALQDHALEPLSAAELPVLDLGAGVTVRVLKEAEHGSAVLVEKGRARVLLPIGLRRADETEWLMRGSAPPATALVLGNSAPQEKWLWAINPPLVLLAVDAQQMPLAPEVLPSLAGRTVLRTDEHGTLTLFTDGERLWVETEH